MRCLYVLLYITICQSGPVDKPKTHLVAPNVISARPSVPNLYVYWNKVQSSDPEEPVVGYKVRIWEEYEVKDVKSKTYRYVDGELKSVGEDGAQASNENCVCENGPIEIHVPAPQNRMTYKNFRIGVKVNIKVRAYSAKEDGPWSPTFGTKIE